MKSGAMSQVDKSRVNRDFSVREPSSHLKPDLASQLLFVCNTSRCITRRATQGINTPYSSRSGRLNEGRSVVKTITPSLDAKQMSPSQQETFQMHRLQKHGIFFSLRKCTKLSSSNVLLLCYSMLGTLYTHTHTHICGL